MKTQTYSQAQAAVARFSVMSFVTVFFSAMMIFAVG